MALYTTDSGQPVTTQSMIKCFRNCPRDAYYKYKLRLKPKRVRMELTRGKWFHALLEAYMTALAEQKGEPHANIMWKREHERWCRKFTQLFDEEKDELGDLPNIIKRMFLGYLWHYGDPAHTDRRWTVHEVETTLEFEMPNGHIFRCRIDAIVEDDFGLWAVDHKSHKRMPDWEKRMLDEQSPMYILACHENGIPVQGFIWNYIIVKPGITSPSVVKDGSRFYSRDLGGDNTDYPTFVRAIKAAKAEHGDVFLAGDDQKDRVRAEMARLKSQRWAPDVMPTSPHFRRDVIGTEWGRINRVLAAAVRTSDTMHGYDFSDPDRIERNVGACRSYICDYASLSMADLINGHSEMIIKRDYREEDPLAYYDNEEEGL